MSTILALMNIILSLASVVYNVRYLVKCHFAPAEWRWIKVSYTLVGVFWFVVYCWIFLKETFELPGIHGQIFVRPGITVTLALITAGAIIRTKYCK